MFVEDFVDVALPLAAVRGSFTGDDAWLAPLANTAADDGETLRLRVGPRGPGRGLTREVRVRLGPARQRGDAVVVPLAWEATEHSALFPALNGDLELAPLGPDVCRLTLSASYAPPFGDLGRALDTALLHHLAQSTVRSFLSQVASTLEGQLDPALRAR